MELLFLLVPVIVILTIMLIISLIFKVLGFGLKLITKPGRLLIALLICLALLMSVGAGPY